ncbi:ATP-dependent DNA/RNA helicase DHX36-like isoform X3 [Vespa mandarinia]|uniref:ATP-dependent DNA/RNA helicase DHX36-like isoform X3 n=1 Tax=Vespa mandarinia TaxID=7446 RepID=UPI001609FE52|nr:ATP-dependent DNA/RNA helicase DHX36-like isoform X3 [Vespa mandarinia]
MSYQHTSKTSPRSSRFGRGNEQSQPNSSMSSSQNHGQSGGRGNGHPSWLRGKEIGLYYRDLQKNRAKKRELRIIKLKQKVEQTMKLAVENSKGLYNKLCNDEEKQNSTSNDLENKYTHIHDSQFKRKFLEILSGNIQHNIAKAMSAKSKLERDPISDKSLLDEFNGKLYSSDYKAMQAFRKKLPAYEKKADILDLIKKNQVVVISGETGCGKTTQVAQFILDSELEERNGSITRIICTQPRRISAISVAERVAAERAERLGKSVGFQIRLEKIPPRERGSILFCTTGMLLQFMQSDPALKGFSHIILDEIHERSTESDFIITLLKQIIPVRPDLKVVLMSATLNSERFSDYYNDCPIIHIPGFTYPVEEFYLEDVLLLTGFRLIESTFKEKELGYRKYQKKYKQQHEKNCHFLNIINPYIKKLVIEKKYPKFVIDQLCHPDSENLSLELIEDLINHICTTKEPGAILVFLPGMMDIVKLNRIMLNSGRYPNSRFIIYPLHSRMPTIDQRLIFKEPPTGIRKIIIATSIAETSITIEDVVYVIDCGKTKLSRFDVNKNMETLEPEWVSMANAKQRRGRAGRVKKGYCYHLYSKAREMTFDDYPLPEMLRTRLEEVILQIKILQLGEAKQFLASVMDPPNLKAIDLSLDLLRTLNALDNDEHLTPLGYHLAQLPLDPRTGKMIIWAALFSCIDPVFAIAASLTFKDAFYCPLGKEEQAMKKKLELSLWEFSDHIALAEALRRFEINYNFGFCHEYFLSFNTLKLLSEMKRQFAQHLYEMKFLDNDNPIDEDANRNSNNIALIKAIVCAGLYPNIATIKYGSDSKHGVIAWTPEDGSVKLHPSSVNNKMKDFPSPFLTYFTKQRSTAIYLHDTSCVTAPILLFAGSNSSIRRENGKYIITLNTSQNFICEPRTAKVIQDLRQAINNLLEYKISHPGTVNWDTQEGQILNALIEFVSQTDEEMGFGKLTW